MISVKKHLKIIALALLGSISVEASAVCFAYKALDSQKITSLVGVRWSPTRNKIWPHEGLDMRAAIGTPLYAVMDGTITTRDGAGGGTITLNSSIGAISYMHTDKFIVKSGKVTAGQVIALSGNTGGSAAPHLHLQTKSKTGTVLDTKSFMFEGTLLQANIEKDYFYPGTNKQHTPFPVFSAVGASECTGAPTTATVQGMPTSYPAPDGTQVPTVPVDPASPDGGMGSPQAPIQNFPSMDNLSLRDFFEIQAYSRFPNEQWHRELLDPGNIEREKKKLGIASPDANAAIPTPLIFMLREINILMALKNMMAAERFLQKEQIQAKYAALLSLDAQEYADSVLAITRSSASR